MIVLIERLRLLQEQDDLQETLVRRFDELVTGMNRPGAMATASRALFADPAALAETYKPGITER